ncbi:hypothetical protein N7471_006430 [Penicillium samsonianum]|uniref:uncharacterized protein n=1 Tax=Penicillium samsonianum TaxID=1882272 RepID=UPI0025493B45|nr:uncharacterized protein N7471_006430 [Penicillium samsonianum]KAJ6139944.1 hypothetical protein N7471_006430 [Penicillium samsonianum]
MAWGGISFPLRDILQRMPGRYYIDSSNLYAWTGHGNFHIHTILYHSCLYSGLSCGFQHDWMTVLLGAAVIFFTFPETKGLPLEDIPMVFGDAQIGVEVTPEPADRSDKCSICEKVPV